MQKYSSNKIFGGNNYIKLRRVLYSKSDIGLRQKNEDYAYCGTNKILDNLLIVCDGVGSCKGSEKAAEIVSKTFIKSFLEQEYLYSSTEKWFENNIKKAKLAMRDYILRFADHHKMCTTLVLALTIQDVIHIFWIGDSRAYLISKRDLNQLTNDHNLLNYLINNGASRDEIDREGPNLYSLTNCITMSLNDEQKYDHVSIPIKKNTFIFLASDGFYNFYQDIGSLYDVLSHEGNMENVSEDLVNYALSNQSNDNISFSYIGFLKD
ncbi:MAG: serine/threonine-protein phosphatase [Malacoplasma sp.]|nr:serine/threonine-protein phosphatase [Malacoplasma sp.]MDE5775085.1 serine/threonine-protein phosphatase [Malacoplasma sp.]